MTEEHPKRTLFDYLVAQENEERVERRGLEQRALALFGALLIGVPVVATVAKDADFGSAAGIVGLVLVAVAFTLVVVLSAQMALALGTDPQAGQGIRRLWAAVRHIMKRPAKASTGVKLARLDVMNALSTNDYEWAERRQRHVVQTLRDANVALVGNVRDATRKMPVVLILLLLGLGLLALANDPAPQGRAAPHGNRPRR